MKKSATENYTKAKAVVARGTSSMDEMRDQAWSYTQEMARRLSDWWDVTNWDDLKEKIKKHTAGLQLCYASN